MIFSSRNVWPSPLFFWANQVCKTRVISGKIYWRNIVIIKYFHCFICPFLSLRNYSITFLLFPCQPWSLNALQHCDVPRAFGLASATEWNIKQKMAPTSKDAIWGAGWRAHLRDWCLCVDVCVIACVFECKYTRPAACLVYRGARQQMVNHGSSSRCGVIERFHHAQKWSEVSVCISTRFAFPGGYKVEEKCGSFRCVQVSLSRKRTQKC